MKQNHFASHSYTESNKTIINDDSLTNLPSKEVKLIRHNDSLDSEKTCKNLNDELSFDESMEDSKREKDKPDMDNSIECEAGTFIFRNTYYYCTQINTFEYP